MQLAETCDGRDKLFINCCSKSMSCLLRERTFSGRLPVNMRICGEWLIGMFLSSDENVDDREVIHQSESMSCLITGEEIEPIFGIYTGGVHDNFWQSINWDVSFTRIKWLSSSLYLST